MVKVKIVKKITDKGWPVHAKGYASAHQKANQAEKRKNPKLYKEENKAERKMLRHDPHELMATSTKDGKYKIEKKFKKFEPTLLLHEKTERKTLLKRKRNANTK